MNDLKHGKSTVANLIEEKRNEVLQDARKPALQTKQTEMRFGGRLALNPGETAIALSLSLRSVERLLKTGELRSQRAGRRIVIPISAIEQWLSQEKTRA